MDGNARKTANWCELKKRKFGRGIEIDVYGQCETEDHIFFGCIMVKNVWSCFKEALGWDRIPHNLQDIFYS